MKAIYKLNSDASVLSTSSGNKKWPSLFSEGTQKKIVILQKLMLKPMLRCFHIGLMLCSSEPVHLKLMPLV